MDFYRVACQICGLCGCMYWQSEWLLGFDSLTFVVWYNSIGYFIRKRLRGGNVLLTVMTRN